jgi:hypothetical protein
MKKAKKVSKNGVRLHIIKTMKEFSNRKTIEYLTDKADGKKGVKCEIK